jgi:hypothetical protein
VLHDGQFGGKQVTAITTDLLDLLKKRHLEPLTVQSLWQQKSALMALI